MRAEQAEQLVREGRLAEALVSLEEMIRGNPGKAPLRVFLFQLLCVLGQWERAMTQLNVAADMDSANLLMAKLCRPALLCERLRAEVFAGKRSPLIFGEPEAWVGWMVQANQLDAQGEFAPASDLRGQALQAAPAVAGSLNDQPFEWIADTDNRLGPMLEAIIDGRYYWVPFAHVHQLQTDPVTDLRDLVWAPATFTWSNGGESFGLIPVRYPGSESCADSALQMARRTEWRERPGGQYAGLGQRLFTTDSADYALLETRLIILGQGAPGTDGKAP
jgi:type VI secretion system protein ImpE